MSFPYSALIYTPRGLVAIGEIRVGDTVHSMTRQGGLVGRRVTRVLAHGPTLVWKAHLESGKELRATPSQTFRSSRAWKIFRKFRPGDGVVYSDQTVEIVRSLAADGVEPVTDLYTEGEHTLVVDGFVAHNFSSLRWPRAVFHQWCIDPPPEEATLVN